MMEQGEKIAHFLRKLISMIFQRNLDYSFLLNPQINSSRMFSSVVIKGCIHKGPNPCFSCATCLYFFGN